MCTTTVSDEVSFEIRRKEHSPLNVVKPEKYCNGMTHIPIVFLHAEINGLHSENLVYNVYGERSVGEKMAFSQW